MTAVFWRVFCDHGLAPAKFCHVLAETSPWCRIYATCGSCPINPCNVEGISFASSLLKIVVLNDGDDSIFSIDILLFATRLLC